MSVQARLQVAMLNANFRLVVSTLAILFIMHLMIFSDRRAPRAGPVVANPRCKPVSAVCPVGELFNCYGPCKEKHCFASNEPDVECATFRIGCFCMEGYVRKYPGGPCVEKKSCHRVGYGVFSSG